MRAIEGERSAAEGRPYRDPDRGPTVALVGARALEQIPDSVLIFVVELGGRGKVLLRRGMKSQPGLFERAMAALCRAEGVDYEWIMPDPDGGREATYLRDVELARRADLVLAFFADEKMAGGTEHVVEKAIDVRTPVYAWGRTPEGSFRRIGEHDPDNVWGSRLPAI